jgi:hypothetical protein
VKRRVAIAVLAAGVLAAIALQPGGSATPRPRPAESGVEPQAAPAPPETPVDPGGLRELFRFGDEPAPEAARSGATSAPEVAPGRAERTGPRMVGLVRRGGRLVAVLVADGEVVLAGPGESAFDLTVLSVDSEASRVRYPDGREETLPLP